MADRAAARIRAAELSDQMEEHFSQPGKVGLFIPKPAGNDSFRHWNADVAWPAVDPLLKPLGSLVLVQFRQPIAKSAGGMHIIDEIRDTDRDNETVVKVVAVGPLAFHNRSTGDLWPEGAWCKPGDYVRVSKYQGNMFKRDFKREDFDETPSGERIKKAVADHVRFALVRDLDISAAYDSLEAALAERAFI